MGLHHALNQKEKQLALPKIQKLRSDKTFASRSEPNKRIVRSSHDFTPL